MTPDLLPPTRPELLIIEAFARVLPPAGTTGLSQRTLADRTGLGPAVVRETVARLAERGWAECAGGRVPPTPDERCFLIGFGVELAHALHGGPLPPRGRRPGSAGRE
jgi:DNA-binding IclR family transcriptional regulator